MNSAVKLVIFDWDGTLFDSVGQIVASLKFAADQYSQPLTDTDAKSIIGLGLPEVAQRLFPTVPEFHSDILQSYADHYVAHSKGDMWFDGVADMLQELRDAGLQLAVATGKSRKGLDRVLAQTQSHELFCATRAASETKSKPDPLMLAEILAETGLRPDQAIMVGDTSYDLEMALNIQMPRVGVSYGVHTVETLQCFQPLHIAHSVGDLTEFLLEHVKLRLAV
ncbi:MULTISPECIES: HAD-IA family hydrolase [unclassified Acinetobacter]|uniref:HAD-IA family hydrolase n=1 Tax=unclassified Acinetobacter TaxID=196816 RepID=UPI0015D34CFF|nr:MULTISPECIES: HAD-IA family hydrolase [unclassified Acinetobacter]UUS64881.1 HAD-IA family hydrolase [Acinetobacter sp. YH12068_T]